MRLPPILLAASILFVVLPGRGQSPLLRPLAPVPGPALELAQRERALLPSIERVGFVGVDTAALRALRPGDQRALSFFEAELPLRVIRVGESLDHRLVEARLAEHGTMVWAIGPSDAIAAHATFGGHDFTLRSTGIPGLVLLADHDLRRADDACGVLAAAAAAAETTTPLADTVLVDIAVFYTPLARANLGGQAAAEAEMHLRTAMANQANAGSAVTWRFRLVYTGETQLVEPDPVRLVTVLQQLSSTSDGVMDDVHSRRALYGADLVALVCDGNNRDWTGYAWCRSTASNAFSVTHRAGLVSHLLHHEMGHNLGCAHNRANVDCSGSFSYSYGWRTPDNKWHTVMAYAGGSPPSQRVNAWSSPSVVHQGYTMGTATDDNARSLQSRGPVCAQFLPMRTLEWTRLSGGITGTLGRPELLGRGTVDATVPPAMSFRQVPAQALGVLALGGRTIDLPIFGGTLVPSLDVLLAVTGSSTTGAAFLIGLPPATEVWCQAFFADAAAVQGLSATDGVKTRRP